MPQLLVAICTGCPSPSISTIFYLLVYPYTLPAVKFDVRLADGDWLGEGRVEVFDGKQWGTVCADGFGNLEATVVCRQLGYDSGVVVPSDRVIFTWGMGAGLIRLANVNCSQQPRTARLRSCAYQSWEGMDLANYDPANCVGARCYGKGTPRSPSPPVPPYPPVPSRWTNVAAGRPVYTSSVLTGDPAVGLCENAVCRPVYVTDGNVSNPLRMFQSDLYDHNPWVSIDFGGLVAVYRIQLYFGIGCCGEAMGGVELRVGNTSITRVGDVGLIRSNPVVWATDEPGNTGGQLDAILQAPAVGRWLTLQAQRNTVYYVDRVLQVLELQAFGVETGRPSPPSPRPPSPQPPAPSPPTIPFFPGGITAGAYHTCALSPSLGAIKCFGRNKEGQLGLGDTQDRGDQKGEMGADLPIVSLGRGLNVTAVAAGCFHTCALLAPGGIVKCWGLNDHGQLGLGDKRDRGGMTGDMGDALPAVDLGSGLRATAIAAGCNHTCAILQPANIVKCWGYNIAGQLGLEDYRSRGDHAGEMGPLLPAVDLQGGKVIALALGESHSCALLQPGGTVKCWGANSAGQLGQDNTEFRGDEAGEMGDALLPVDLGRSNNALALATESAHVCVVLASGANNVKCWGSNSQGQLGLGDAFNRGDGLNDGGVSSIEMGKALPEVPLGRNLTASALAVGEFHTCAILQPDRLVKCWGGNKFGQLGLGDKKSRGDEPGEMGNSLQPVDLGEGLSATALAAGARHTCALLQPGNLIKCWGSNDFGALGLGDRVIRGDKPDEMGDNLPPLTLW
ncbi:hypothetical protein Vretimale_16631 [Volvox reticuliferus]|uniref:SRCR domain-containing protein n=1 Tax=Volvox reticuliferus TaxID=1737510 RepID=A0A8J4D182_9CHLO|nr:hypothetical protein Vretifemale_17416 [Volvox reticuliferus]GIM13582.1 hypothetical protein Vretimale_16631 [Volvox reticuliferus]